MIIYNEELPAEYKPSRLALEAAERIATFKWFKNAPYFMHLTAQEKTEQIDRRIKLMAYVIDNVIPIKYIIKPTKRDYVLIPTVKYEKQMKRLAMSDATTKRLRGQVKKLKSRTKPISRRKPWEGLRIPKVK